MSPKHSLVLFGIGCLVLAAAAVEPEGPVSGTYEVTMTHGL